MEINKVRYTGQRDQLDAAIRDGDNEAAEKANDALWQIPGSLDYQQEYLDKKYGKRN